MSVTEPTVNLHAAAEAKPKPLPLPKPRLWPAILLVGLYWLARLIAVTILGGTFTQFMILFWGPIALGLGLLIWLLGFSRLPWADRSIAVLGMIVAGGLAALVSHKTMVMALPMFALPMALSGAALWGVASYSWASAAQRRASYVAVCLLCWGAYALLRMDGVSGRFDSEISWRWLPTAEEKFLAQRKTESPPHSPEPLKAALVATAADWPEFRGTQRDGRRAGVRIATDWKEHPPQQLWKKRVGPGWSSISVVGDYGFTQEQRGEKEAVVCFRVADGEEVWSYEDETRFFEIVAGAGPRATPTFVDGRLYTLGASGKLNCFDAATGERIWGRDLTHDSGAKIPTWGFASSPLVTNDLVIVVSGKEKAGDDSKPGVVAYDAASGDVRWKGGKAQHSYASAQLHQIDGVEQVLIVSDFGLESFELKTGAPLWENEWKLDGMARCVQPTVLESGEILLGSPFQNGIRSLKVARGQDSKWNVEEVWQSKGISPYFNDLVVFEGYGYGFDGDIFRCVDLKTGERQKKFAGRYGSGQVLLLADQGVLLIVTEADGALVLVEANPDKVVELARLPALASKTWNHPVLAGDKLLIRNGEEMACYQLSLEK
jgi:outer membrane protein assembly factor BamB